MSWWRSFFSSGIPSPAGKYVGQLGDGRALVDLRALPNNKLDSEHATEIVRELADYKGRKVLLVDEAFLCALKETSVFMEFMDLAHPFTGQGDEVFVAHQKGEPPVDVDPATLYLLRSYALEVRPFMLVG